MLKCTLVQQHAFPIGSPLPLPVQVYTAGRFDCPGEFEARLVLDSRSGPPPAAHFECGCCPRRQLQCVSCLACAGSCSAGSCAQLSQAPWQLRPE